MLHQPGAGAGADAGDVEQLGLAVADLAALAVVGDGEAVRLVADALDEVQDGRAAVEDDGIVLLPVEVDHLFAFCNRRERLRGEAELFKRRGCRVELAEAAVDEDERGHLASFGAVSRARIAVGCFHQLRWAGLLQDALVAAADDLAHGGEVVDAGDGLHLEFAVVGLLHRAVLPHHHRGDRLRALDVRDVEALDAARQLGQHEQVLQRFLNRLLRGLQHAEALIVALLRVLADEVDQRTLLATLRRGDLHAMAGALGEQMAERLAIREVDRHQDGARHVLLIDVELLEQGREEGGGLKAPAWCAASGAFSA